MIAIKDKMTEGITLRNLVSMTNGVVGLSILTMPYCFKECGLILGTLTLLFCALMTSYSCKLILRTIQMAKINSFEYLAYKTFGERGKLLIELCIILLLYGSLVTNQQALCDTGPAFVSKLFNLNEKTIPRSVFMLIFTLLISLPLALSKKLEALHSLNASAILFYFTFGLYLMWEAGFKLVNHEWIDKVRWWHFSGLLKCFPIFSISFSCQTVLFVVYGELENKDIIFNLSDLGIFISFICYFLTGIFGYLAYFDVPIYGNITYNIPTNFLTQLFLFGFIICVISGFPFIIYPCRTSLNTLLFSRNDELIDTDIYIPEDRFKKLTYLLVSLTVTTAVLIPNLEFVLSLTGATAGSLIAYVWPSMINKFIKTGNEHRNELFLNIFLFIGIVIFCICSIATFFEFEPTKENDEILANDANSFTTTTLKKKAVLPIDGLLDKMAQKQVRFLTKKITAVRDKLEEKKEDNF